MKKYWLLLLVLAAALGRLAVSLPTAAEQETAGFKPSNLFDTLTGKEDVIYLVNNTSFVWGPDPKGRSEEITFTGLVTVPKWPMAGYQRRVLPDGRQQIDIELTESLLVGESFLLGGQVGLLEHPDLRSLGTITEPAQPAKYSMEVPRGIRYAQTSGVRKISIKGSEQMAKVIQDNPSVPWETLIAKGMRQWTEQVEAIKTGKIQPQAQTAVPKGLVDLQLNLPEAVVARIEAHPEVRWDVWLNETLVSIVSTRPDLVVGGGSPIAGTVIPSDFVVARKVLLNTAKGLLYNETAVPVRGKLDSIPPVKLKGTATGVNVFLGMELPVPLINEEGAVDGWFYSGAHTALSVRPKAVERAQVEGTVTLRVGDQLETVKLKGPAEIHHGDSKAANGKRESEVEVVVLGLRGHSKLLGGDLMLIEHYSVDAFKSRGRIDWASDTAGTSKLDLYVSINTPAGMLTNSDPIVVSGSIRDFAQTGALVKGNLNMPLVGAAETFQASTERALFNEVDQKVASLVKLDLKLTKDGPHVHPQNIAETKPAEAKKSKGGASR
ncbi:MAG TPA: DUF6004 family protein [Thermoanaerobaculia bacterium]|nr:DUF6004 family protein [Thermoanaerobaculia bacterium]